MGCFVANSTKFVLALFLQTCLVLGTVKSLGVFLRDIDISLEMTDTDNGIMFGIYMAMTFCPGPLITYLFHKRVFRRLQMLLGAILGPIGFLCAAIASNKIILITCLAFSGFGNCLMSVCSIISLSEIAPDRFNIIYGFGKSGYAFGMSVIPLVANFLMELYDWRGAMMIIGAFMAHTIPLAMSHETGASASSNLESTSGQVEGGERHQLQECRDRVEESGRPTGSRMRSDLKMVGCSSRLVAAIKQPTSSERSGDSEITSECHRLLDDSQRESGSVSPRNLEETHETQGSNLINLKVYCTWMKESVFYQDPFLISILLGNFAFGMVNSSWHSFLIPRAVDRCIPTTPAIGLVTSAAVACFIGRFLVGYFNIRCLTYHDVAIVMTLVNIFSLLVESFTRNYIIMLATSFVSSLAIASRSALFVIIVKERGPASTFPMLFAITEVLYGLGAFFGPYIEGMMGDLLGSLDKAFFLLAALDSVVFVMLIPARYVKSQFE